MWEISPVVLCNELLKLTCVDCVMIWFFMRGHALFMCASSGSLFLKILTMSLNHKVKSSLMALTKGWPFGPYAMHRVEYLHRPCIMPVALAAEISILFHSALDRPCT